MSEYGGGETMFYARALQNWKSKEKGALPLSKGGLVKVLSGSADGEKFFGEVGKKKGWFPQIFVKREAGAPASIASVASVVQSFKPTGEGDDSTSPSISGPTHVRKHSQSLETLSLLADQLPPNAISELENGGGKAKEVEAAASSAQDDVDEGGSNSRILKRSVTVNHLRQQNAGEDRARLDDMLRGSGGRQLGRSLDQARIHEVGEDGVGGEAAGSDDQSVDRAEEQNAAIARLKRNRTLPHLRPPMPSISHAPAVMAFSSPALSPTSIAQMSSSAPISPRSSPRSGGMRPGLHNGTTSHSFNTLPINALGGSPSAGGPSSPRSRVASAYVSSSQPSSPTASSSSSSSPPSSLSSSPLESPRRTRSSSSHSGSHPPITSIFPQRSVSSESHQAVTAMIANNAPSPLSRLSATSSSRRQSRSTKDEKKEKKKKEKEKREGSKRKPNLKKGSPRQPDKDVFGVSLEELMQRQRLDHPYLQVPIVLLNCAHAIILLEGHKKEGIFRISGNAHNLESLKEMVREQEYADDFQDAHNAASLMKIWLSSLPQALIPDSLTKQCTESISDPEKSVQIVSEMPEINQKTLGYVIQFLQQFILPEKTVTKMDEDNLAMTLVPVIFGQNDSIGDMVEIVKQTHLQKVFVVNLLMHMKFPTPLAWKDFEDAIEVINIKTAANQQMARELKKKGKTGGLIGGLVKPFSPGEKLSKEGAQYNTYNASGGIGSPRYEDLSSSGSGAIVDESGGESERSERSEEEDDDEMYEFG